MKWSSCRCFVTLSLTMLSANAQRPWNLLKSSCCSKSCVSVKLLYSWALWFWCRCLDRRFVWGRFEIGISWEDCLDWFYCLTSRARSGLLLRSAGSSCIYSAQSSSPSLACYSTTLLVGIAKLFLTWFRECCRSFYAGECRNSGRTCMTTGMC